MNLAEAVWAKTGPYKKLKTHMLEAGAVCGILMTDSSLRPAAEHMANLLDLTLEQMAAAMSYLAAMHDIGKCHPVFQRRAEVGECPQLDELLTYISNGADYPIAVSGFRHEKQSKQIFQRIAETKRGFDKKTARKLAQVLELHHQGHNPGIDCKNWAGMEVWTQAQDELEDILWQTFQPEVISIPRERKIPDTVCTLMLGFVVLSDWIASGEMFAETDNRTEPERCIAKVREMMGSFLENANMRHETLPDYQSFTELWPSIPADAVRPIQSAAEALLKQREDTPSLLLIEAPMGEGKTEAGLYAAARMMSVRKKDGFYMALPTAATSNAMQERLDELLNRSGNGKTKLLHSMAWLVDAGTIDSPIASEEEQYARNWTAPLRRGMLVPFAVGTIDQAMMAAMVVKFGALRQTGLAGKVLVMDEIHAYDAYMSAIIEGLLAWCRVLNVPVVMLSATLPAEKKKSFISVYTEQFDLQRGYPCLTAVYADGACVTKIVPDTFVKKRVGMKLLPIGNDSERIARTALKSTEAGGCACVLMNTVAEAQRVYRSLKECAPPETDIRIFHAGFPAGRRDELEKACLSAYGKDKSKRPVRSVLVATQVVEQSLDLDFDVMFSQIAPIDLLLQRMGRLHRHSDTVRPEELAAPVIYTLVPEKPDDWRGTGYVYHPYYLGRTLALLQKHDTVLIPEDIEPAVSYVYSEEPREEEMSEWLEQAFNVQTGTALAQQSVLQRPNEKDFSWGVVGHMLEDSEQESGLSARTRIGPPSVRIAFLKPDLYQQYLDCSYVSKGLAETIMKLTVSQPLRRLQAGLTAGTKDGIQPLEGKGLLSGVFLLPSDNGVCEMGNNEIWNMDNEIGFTINKGGTI